MYCKNCGNLMDDHAAVCIKCGVAAGIGKNYCHNCGAQVGDGQLVCIQCGAALGNMRNAGYGYAAQPNKSRIAAGVLAILLGWLGVHNFYLGFTGRAVAQLLISLLTCGIGAFASVIWSLIEGILILTRQINYDAQGLPLTE